MAARESALAARVVAGSRFLVVGALGLAVNQGLLWLMVEAAHVHYLVAAVLASQGSTAFNFAGVEAWVFRGRRRDRWLARFIAFDALNVTGLVLRLPLLFLLTSGLRFHYLLSNLVSIAILTLLRFVVSEGAIWSEGRFPS